MSDTEPKRDYRDTVFLPKTDFPMKAGLPQKEPGILARWEEDGLYRQLRKARAGREKFILHDGPPYANGDIHIGHALNKVLKDAVVRTQTLLGKDAPYVPGWDCHGLPIEWKIEEAYRKKKRDKDQVPPKEFRQECRDYAAKWVDVQREQFKRLGVLGEWDKPYLTMAPAAEAGIVAELLKFAESGQLYRGAKPVMWSPVEKTALAEAEVEYEDIVSTQIDVAFEIVESPIEELVGAHAVIWTTTPWTIPVNQALAYGPAVEYVVGRPVLTLGPDEMYDAQVERDPMFLQRLHGRAQERNHEFADCRFIVARELCEAFSGRLLSEPHLFSNFKIERHLVGKGLAGTVAQHPMHQLGGFFAEPRPLLPGDFVTAESGTGIVHMAPDHGEDDFELCKANGITPKFVVDDDGRYREDWGWLPRSDERSGSVINPRFNAPDGPICEDLKHAGALLSASTDYQHSYPHSWRSKAKVIFRCTPQWFVPMDRPLGGFDYDVAHLGGIGGAVALGTQADHTATLRDVAMGEIAKTRFVPAKGKNRIGSMVEGRPDWVLSRQRAWGVPITLFVNRESGDYLVDKAVNARIVQAIGQDGVDAWTQENAAQLLGPDYAVEDYEMITDILDVWFDSGSTHAFVLESDNWPDLQSPADLYLEGSDQHRGWFQSSLLESCATRGRAPYRQVLTHGFTMAADGRKMSKSLGNTVDPLKVMEEYGADIIRLWALSVDYTEDHRIGPEILKGVADQYRKLRNTFRYMLGALGGFDESERVEVSAMPELERYVLALLGELDGKLRTHVENYDFDAYSRALVDFMNEDLSAFFFDIRKDRLYCDAPDGLERRAYRTVLDTLFHALIRYAAPVLVFTAEEVWGTRYPEEGSVHLLEWPELPHIHRHPGLDPGSGFSSGAEGSPAPDQVRGDDLLAKWDDLRRLRSDLNEAIEPLRREKVIRSSLEAKVEIFASFAPPASEDELAELGIVSEVHWIADTPPTDAFRLHHVNGDVVENSGFIIARSNESKCGRCWRLLPEVEEDGDLCNRCAAVVAEMDAAA